MTLPPLARALRGLGRVLMPVLVAALAACAGLPAAGPKPASLAHDDTGRTALGRVAQASLDGAPAGASGFRLLPDGDQALAARLALIERAERSIDAQYYLIADDRSGRAFARALRDAAARGVRVRLLVDDFYAQEAAALLAGLDADAGAQVRVFNPLPVRRGGPFTRLALSIHEFSRVNRRMHNKLLVADSRFAIVGGRNIADEYFLGGVAGRFIDMDVLAAGPVVAEMSAVFDRFWNGDGAWPLATLDPYGPGAADRLGEILAAEPALELVPARDSLGLTPLPVELEGGRVDLHLAPARVLADTPARALHGHDDVVHPGALYEALAGMLRGRQEVVIASPYFIPGERGLSMIEQATGAGVRVRVLTNSAGGTDEPLAHWRYAQYRRRVLELGVEVFELSPTLAARASRSPVASGSSSARLHSKLAVVDRRQVLIGSMNMDPRSARVNTEIGLWIDSPALARSLLEWCALEPLADAYRVRLRADQPGVEWVTADEPPQFFAAEPELGMGTRLRHHLVSWLVDEELL
jgi:putative cardiolipin synthase